MDRAFLGSTAVRVVVVAGCLWTAACTRCAGSATDPAVGLPGAADAGSPSAQPTEMKKQFADEVDSPVAPTATVQAPPDPVCAAGAKVERGEGVVRCLRGSIPEGPEVRWNPDNGKVIAQLTYKSGKKSGPAKYYALDGALRMETTYRDDTENGMHRQFAAGRLVWEGEMADGKSQGRWTWYRPTNGSIDRIECQVDGVSKWTEHDKASAEARACPP